MFIVALAYLAFFSIALPDTMLGVAWPSMRLSFDQPTSAAGLVPPFGVAAGLISTTLAPHLVRRVGVGRLLGGGTPLSAAALAVSAASATFWQFLVSVVLLGLSAGAVDATLNAYAARRFGPRRINLLHASYGVGAVVSPLIVTAVVVSGASWRWAYVIVACLQLVVAAVFAATWQQWQGTPRTPNSASDQATRPDHTSVWTIASVLGLLTVALQTGIESSVALWAYIYLTEGVGVGAILAGGLASGYWLTMIIGRISFGALAERIGTWRVMAVAVGLLLAASVMVNLPGSAVAMAAIILFGLATAPLYPLLILTTAERTGDEVADRVVGLQAGASSLGAALIPPLVGLAMDRTLSAFGITIAILCVLTGCLHALIRARRRRHGHRSSG